MTATGREAEELGRWRFADGVAPDAACLDGHFPGDPVVPAAALLAQAALSMADAGLAVAEIRRAKFLRPLRPGRPFEIVARASASGVSIRWLGEEGTLAEATGALRPVDA